MAFASLTYFAFLLIVLALVGVVKNLNWQKWVLLTASYVFFGFWNWRFVALLGLTTLANYALTQRMRRVVEPSYKRNLLVGGAAMNLGVLGYFKYANFFLGIGRIAVEPFGLRLPVAHILLPVAISFITFEFISYLVDAYRGDTEYASNFVDFALLVAFFPHLIAGPILKPRLFLPQLSRPLEVTWDNVQLGLQLFLWGLVKKLIVADTCAIMADEIFKYPGKFSQATLALGVISYGIQIYSDFSGYSDMAIGSAKCFGIEIPRNFNLPYLSTSIAEFWRRWHISLSTWLRDYLYFPLGGNRKGKARAIANLMVVMLLGGLWHGASWNFVIWGGLHGAALALDKQFGRAQSITESAFGRALVAVSTITFVFLAWIPFRAVTAASTFTMFRGLLGLTGGHVTWFSSGLLIAIPFLVIADAMADRWYRGRSLNLAIVWQATCFFFLAWCILLFKASASSPFIYFQF